MICVRWMIPLLLWGMLLACVACGKKGPPMLPRKDLAASVAGLSAEWANGEVLLKGNITGPEGPEEAVDSVRGCRVRYAQYPLESPPCDGCPIDYHGDYVYGPEVIKEKGFLCKVPAKTRGQIYFFTVHLIGAEGSVGPSSEKVKVIVE